MLSIFDHQTSGDNLDEEAHSFHTNIPKKTDSEPHQIVPSQILQDIVIVWDNTTLAFPRVSNTNGYTPASLANITSQPKEELDVNGTYF